MLNDVPQAGQTLAATQNLIQQNFSVIDTAFTVNHVPYNDGSGDQGKHSLVQFDALASAPSPAVGDISLYNYSSALTGLNELFIVKADGTTTTPMTANHEATNGWTYLPSGLLIKWGTTNPINSSNPFVYTYPVSGSTPVFSAVYNVIISSVDTTSPFSGVLALQSGTITTTGFSIVYSGTPTSTTAAMYIAIGK